MERRFATCLQPSVFASITVPPSFAGLPGHRGTAIKAAGFCLSRRSLKAGAGRRRRNDLKRVINERFNVDFHERYVGVILRKLGFSHISARPRHPGQDADVIAAYKKLRRFTEYPSCGGPQGMIRKSGTYYCDKIMLKLLIWRMFRSSDST
ncbi:winged helix-turn-helix domain-containing protein [Aestuariivirga sp.]|uniref:helix-turn-helix domain-containing protein n=1 Tax=Aestuariivirga sp. TaxID=2650926 RepID=UPI0025BE9956|nr:winged helix-turn-helix domain-containing protein [Aestuariivirga sp.]